MSKSLRLLMLVAACLFSFQTFAQNVFTFNDGLQRSTPEEQGVRTEAILKKFLVKTPVFFEPATGDVRGHGALFPVDPASGRCTAAEGITF